jgi:hypothetical protein
LLQFIKDNTRPEFLDRGMRGGFADEQEVRIRRQDRL